MRLPPRTRAAGQRAASTSRLRGGRGRDGVDERVISSPITFFCGIAISRPHPRLCSRTHTHSHAHIYTHKPHINTHTRTHTHTNKHTHTHSHTLRGARSSHLSPPRQCASARRATRITARTRPRRATHCSRRRAPTFAQTSARGARRWFIYFFENNFEFFLCTLRTYFMML